MNGDFMQRDRERLLARRPGESQKAHHIRTRHYLPMGPKRSVKGAHLEHGVECLKWSQEEATKWRDRPAPSHMRRWAADGGWAPDGAEYDALLGREMEATSRARLIEARERHAAMAADALAALAAPVRSALEAIQDREAMDRIAQASKTDPAALMKLWDLVARAAYAISSLVQTERLAIGDATGRQELAGPDGGPIAFEDLSRLSDEELEALEAILERIPGRREKDEALSTAMRRNPEARGLISKALELATTAKDSHSSDTEGQ